ncbi:PadR family transcriptional regulator [Paludifilum halophilum]|uniref:PadR family transcriptional regulator n=1 Tax=Paludifilum halophilum TaxID=1642702 RepID=A0A235B4A7_9BACL|nr:PadR family transcriptional regulator [Paludifilum halophilum]OYD07138.1 hypothetical protein CHM34_12135 [Paludifilum halophilum]
MYIEIIILGQLLSGPKHGYEIKKNIQEALGETVKINNNMLYPALRRFLEMGAISKEVVESEGKPNRHVYLLTEAGEKIFSDIIRDFSSKLAGNQMEFLMRVALFDRLEPATQQEILQKRREVLEDRLEHYHHIGDTHPDKPFVKEIIRFQKDQVEHELEWIERLKQQVQNTGEKIREDTDRPPVE